MLSAMICLRYTIAEGNKSACHANKVALLALKVRLPSVRVSYLVLIART